jgi:midasin
MRPVRNRSALQADAIRNATVTLKDLGLEPSGFDVENLTTILYSASKSADLGSDPQLLHRLQDAYESLSRSNSIFEWRDGPLIDAMRNGGVFLMDEISLADDSILERLNSVLEHGRSIVLAERGGANSENTTIQADEHFRLVATMNPGGDYGKKELSLALRNRFTEIWVPPIDDRQDLELVVNSCWTYPSLRIYTFPLLDFIDWLCLRVGDRSLLGLRDILVSVSSGLACSELTSCKKAWVGFVNVVYDQDQSEKHAQLSDQIFVRLLENPCDEYSSKVTSTMEQT